MNKCHRKDRCETCTLGLFQYPDPQSFGECHRYPKIRNVTREHWCAEHRSAEETAPVPATMVRADEVMEYVPAAVPEAVPVVRKPWYARAWEWIVKVWCGVNKTPATPASR